MYRQDLASDNADKVLLAVADSVLDDLRYRLVHTRWPPDWDNEEWVYGTDRRYLQSLVSYWADGYDWRAQERWLNGFPHFRSQVSDLVVHYVHQRSPEPDAIPILLLHGWPGSFVQMLKLIPMLVNPKAHGLHAAPAFHVVVASLPGFGFSDAPERAGLNLERIGAVLSRLMIQVLGYQRYAVRGSDLGGATIDQMCRHFPDQIIGAHLTQIIISGGVAAPVDATAAERKFFDASASMALSEIAYARQQMTKPQSLAYALSDSPAGLAGWIVEKYRSWGDTSGDIDSRFDKNFLITTLMTYWLSNNIGPSVRTYFEMARNRGNTSRITVPTAFLMSERDLFPAAPRELAERSHNVQQFSTTASGGHFLEWEEPLLVAQDIQKFFANIL